MENKKVKTPGPGKGGARKGAKRPLFNPEGGKRVKTGYTFAEKHKETFEKIAELEGHKGRSYMLDVAGECVRNTAGLPADQKAATVALNAVGWAIRQLEQIEDYSITGLTMQQGFLHGILSNCWDKIRELGLAYEGNMPEVDAGEVP